MSRPHPLRSLASERAIPYWLILPTVVYVAVFFLVPVVQALLLAFRTQDGQWTTRFLWRMVQDIQFASALRFTLLLLAIVVPLQLATALLIALLVNTKFRGSRSFLYICAIPLGISDLAAGLIWFSLFTQHGYINSFLYGLGLTERPIFFLSAQNVSWVVGSIVLAEHWRATAIVLVILVAGLQMISRDYLEAAEVFGARPWQRLWHVTLPLLKPSLQSALIIRTILALQMFAVVVALGGRMVPVLAGEAYYWYYLYRNTNVASAYALLLMVISALLAWGYLRFLRPREVRS
ncbi:MAG TPA: sugar ABC transporter permease [Candidatus Acetothermia bacterium]|nr:sugar ABC transporter permease [Candidatus Acetothermia bacterium]